MKKQNISPLCLDTYGTRGDRLKKLHTPTELYARKAITYIAVLLFIITDFYCMFVLFDMCQSENVLFVILSSLAIAIALDVPLSIAAIKLREYEQGLTSKRNMLITSITSVSVFLIAFACSFAFRIDTKDIAFSYAETSGIVDTVSGNAITATGIEDTPGTFIPALFISFVPLLTSLASFVISYFSSSPLTDRIYRLENQRVTLEANLTAAERAVAEFDSPEDHCKALLARETDLYNEFIETLDSEGDSLKMLARTVLMEKLRTSDDLTVLSESSEAILNGKDRGNAPSPQLENFIIQTTDNALKTKGE